MPSLRIVLDPERDGLGLGVSDPKDIVHLAADAEIVVSGLPDGMVGGRPSMMFGFKLPDGRVVIAETSWRLFAAAYKAFAGQFGDDTAGLALEYDATGAGQRRPARPDRRRRAAVLRVRAVRCPRRGAARRRRRSPDHAMGSSPLPREASGLRAARATERPAVTPRPSLIAVVVEAAVCRTFTGYERSM